MLQKSLKRKIEVNEIDNVLKEKQLYVDFVYKNKVMELKDQMIDKDEIWWFENGCNGFALVRNETIIDCAIARIR